MLSELRTLQNGEYKEQFTVLKLSDSEKVLVGNMSVLISICMKGKMLIEK